MQAKSKFFWRLITIGVVIFFVSAGAYFLLTAGGDSKRLEQSLIDRYGWASEYVPAADGAISADRLERFVRVRQAVQPSCTKYHRVLDGIVGLIEIETDPDVSGGDVASRGVKAFRSMISVAPLMLHFMDARNTTLLHEEMGIGEYMHLYLVAYGKQLSQAADSPYAEMEEAWINDRTREDYQQILSNQLASLDVSDPSSIADALRTEKQRLEDDPKAAPWPDGTLTATRESLAPYQDRLAGLYCDGLVSIELLQKRRKLIFGK